MSRKKQLFFVCIAIDTEFKNLIAETLPAASAEEAELLFIEKFKIKPQKIIGSFYKKKEYAVFEEKNIKFSNQIKEAIYKNWKVNAFILQYPENHAFLAFLKSLDGSAAPQKNNIVPVTELRFK